MRSGPVALTCRGGTLSLAGAIFKPQGLAKLSLDAMGYYGMVMGSALHALSATKNSKGGRLIEDWQAKA